MVTKQPTLAHKYFSLARLKINIFPFAKRIGENLYAGAWPARKSLFQAAIFRLAYKRVPAEGGSSQGINHMLDDGEVDGYMTGSDAAFVVTEDHLHDSV